jgi:hypothetical protein
LILKIKLVTISALNMDFNHIIANISCQFMMPKIIKKNSWTSFIKSKRLLLENRNAIFLILLTNTNWCHYAIKAYFCKVSIWKTDFFPFASIFLLKFLDPVNPNNHISLYLKENIFWFSILVFRTPPLIKARGNTPRREISVPSPKSRKVLRPQPQPLYHRAV